MTWTSSFLSTSSTQPFIRRRSQIEYRPIWPRSRLGAFTFVGWQVALCYLTWQVTLRSFEMSSHNELHAHFTFQTVCCLNVTTLQETDLWEILDTSISTFFITMHDEWRCSFDTVG